MSTDKYVTLRRGGRPSSLSDLSNPTLYDMSITSALDMSAAAGTDSELQKLRSELETANTKIDKLGSEIQYLRTELEKCVSMLSNSSRQNDEPTFSDTPVTSRKRKRIKRNKTTFSGVSQSHDTMDNSETLSADTQNSIKNKATPGVNSMATLEETSTKPSRNKGDEIINRKRRVLIIADQQGKNLCYQLQRDLGSEFQVTSLWKPGARMCQILASEKEEICKLNSDDILIVLGGINDDNPFHFQNSLHAWLSTIPYVNVIITEVPFNKNLNVSRINYELRHLCSKFGNCIFLDLNYRFFVPNKLNQYVCRYLLKEVLAIDYKCKYNNYMSQPQTRFQTAFSRPKLAESATYAQTAKGIVPTRLLKPWYLTKPASPKPDISKVKAVKGTIPFYFKKQTYNQQIILERFSCNQPNEESANIPADSIAESVTPNQRPKTFFRDQ